jgi:hypothetical protein
MADATGRERERPDKSALGDGEQRKVVGIELPREAV